MILCLPTISGAAGEGRPAVLPRGASAGAAVTLSVRYDDGVVAEKVVWGVPDGELGPDTVRVWAPPRALS